MCILSCFLFLFTHTAMAQEHLPPFHIGSNQMESHVWVPLYQGQTNLDEIPVIASLEESQDGVEQPVMGVESTAAPRRAYHLVLTVAQQPSLRTVFALVPSTVNVNGVPHSAFVSDPGFRTDFNFVILTQDNGTLEASYTRREGANDLNKGDFALSPVPHIWQK